MASTVPTDPARQQRRTVPRETGLPARMSAPAVPGAPAEPVPPTAGAVASAPPESDAPAEPAKPAARIIVTERIVPAARTVTSSRAVPAAPASRDPPAVLAPALRAPAVPAKPAAPATPEQNAEIPRLELTSEMSQIYFAVESARTGDRALILQFVGVTGGEGVSTVAVGFARRSAREAQNKILVIACGDDDAGNHDAASLPSLLDLFQSDRPLAGGSRALPAAHGEQGRERVRRARLGAHAQDELNPRLLAAFAEELRRSFNVIVLDCPPVADSPIASLLSRIADGTIIVAAAGQSRRRAMEHAVAEINRMGGNVVGLVLNRQRDWLPGWLRRRLA